MCAHQIIEFFLDVTKGRHALDYLGLSECTQCVPWRSGWAVADNVGLEPGERLTMSRLGCLHHLPGPGKAGLAGMDIEVSTVPSISHARSC